MLRELRKADKSRAADEWFLRLEQHPKCLDQAIQTRKPLGNCFRYKINLKALSNSRVLRGMHVILCYYLPIPSNSDSL